MNAIADATGERRFSLLAVDDERANLNLLKRTFRDDYDIHFADDGISGLDVLRENPVDMIITDQRMPRMTGIQMLVKSQEIAPQAVRIILTAYSDVRDVIDAVNQGRVYQYVLKPWSPDELRLTVANAFKSYALTQENRDLVVKLQKSLDDLNAAQQELVNRERLSAIGRMASSIIHDLKIPMTNIRSAAALLGRENLSSGMRSEFSSVITHEIDRQVDMTREILDFSRGEMRLKRSSFPLGDLLEEVVKFLENDFHNSGITLMREWSDLGVFEGDRERLRRVLLNLLGNARDAMPDGGVIKIIGFPEDGGIHLSVQDGGAGIPDVVMEKLFTPFITHGKRHGTGLGMAIAKNIVEAHQGSISAHNVPLGGAVIDIFLPAS